MKFQNKEWLFSKNARNLNISRFLCLEPLLEKIKYPTLQALFKYRKHPILIVGKNIYGKDEAFKFSEFKRI